MKKPLLVSLVLFAFLYSFSQEYKPEKVNPKAITLYNQAMERTQDGRLPLAIGLLQQSISIDSNYLDAYLSMAGVYGQMKNYRAATEWYEKAIQKDPGYTIEFKLPYSINLAGIGEFEKALAAINDLLDKNPPKNSTSFKAAQYRKRCYEFAVNYEKKNPPGSYVFAPKNLGSNINTAESEYFPSLTIDGQQLVFTRRVNHSNEDFFYSDKENSDWNKSLPIAGDVNTPQNEGAQNISQDGQWLVFTGCNRPDGFGSCDIYISYLTPQGWGEAINMGGTINSDQWESQPCLSPDKRDLYFSSRRFGGFGGADIYVSHLLPNGKWSEPENLGPSVNTAGDEQCPFMHADNQTLYFTSDGWPGYGDQDLFYTRKGPKDSWSNPINLGYPINTIDHEGTLFIEADGKTAYYSSDRNDTKGGLDIYSFDLREDIRPYKTLWVKGKVYDLKTTKGLPSAVELTDMTSGQIISKVQTDETGNFLITLPVGKNYVFNVNRKGYLFYSGNYMLESNAPDSTYKRDIPLQPIEANASIVLNNIFFDINKFDLRPESQIELDKIVQLLNDNPTVKIEISGHTDNQGKPADNLTLSDKRAKTVVAYLINHRIKPDRLTYKGFGETKPVADNKTDTGRAKNRRTELRITSN